MKAIEIDPTLPEWRQKIERFVNHPKVQHVIVFLIVLNAALLGLETSPAVMQAFGAELVMLDHAILAVFILEILLLIAARGLKFFTDPWCVFDLVVVNMFIAVIVDSLNNLEKDTTKIKNEERSIHQDVSALRQQVADQKNDLDELKALLKEQLARSK